MQVSKLGTSNNFEKSKINANIFYFNLTNMKIYPIILYYPYRRTLKQGGSPMEYNYNKLWKLLIDKNLMKKDLMEKTGITSSTIAKMGKNKAVSMEVLGKICMALDCNIGDIVDVVKED